MGEYPVRDLPLPEIDGLGLFTPRRSSFASRHIHPNNVAWCGVGVEFNYRRRRRKVLAVSPPLALWQKGERSKFAVAGRLIWINASW